MKRIIGYVSVFVWVLVASLVVHMPVSFVYQHVPKVPSLNVGTLSGSLWRGQASQVIWQGQSIGHMSWDFQPSMLLTAKAEYQIRFGRGSELQLHGKGTFGLGVDGFYGHNIFMSMPADKILKLAPVPAPVQIEGQLELAIREFQYAQPWCESATGNLAWNGGQVVTPLGEIILGEVTSDLTCQDSKLFVIGEQNHVQVTSAFDASLSSDQTYSVNAWFKPGAEFPSSMGSQLKWLGDPNKKGQFPFQYSGRF